jgi:hypothetical protein
MTKVKCREYSCKYRKDGICTRSIIEIGETGCLSFSWKEDMSKEKEEHK